MLIGGCDKTVPALLMGAASANVPAILLLTGPMMADRPNRKNTSTSVIATLRRIFSREDEWSMDQCAPWARSRSFSHCLMKTLERA